MRRSVTTVPVEKTADGSGSGHSALRSIPRAIMSGLGAFTTGGRGDASSESGIELTGDICTTIHPVDQQYHEVLMSDARRVESTATLARNEGRAPRGSTKEIETHLREPASDV